ncbi:MAG: hypothetical protein NXI00_24430, partial [Cytophagales bacterium]|nr:hypothetical protein [Cytophagales bacterium]
ESSLQYILDVWGKDNKLYVLINAGGLRAGLSNLQVAETLLKKGKSVVFYCLKEQQWTVMDDKKRLKDLHILPNRESNLFCFL